MKHIRKFNESEVKKDENSLNIIKDIFVEFLDKFHTKEIEITDRLSDNNIFNVEFDELDRLFYIIQQSASRSISLHNIIYKNSFYVLLKYIKNVMTRYVEYDIEKDIKIHLYPIINRLKRNGFICNIRYENCDDNEYCGQEATYVNQLGIWCNVENIIVSIHLSSDSAVS
jgi:hypothetical protein